jgi:hypothetical protein
MESFEYINPCAVHVLIGTPSVTAVKNFRNNFRKSVIGPIETVMDQDRVREMTEVGGTVTEDDDHTT